MQIAIISIIPILISVTIVIVALRFLSDSEFPRSLPSAFPMIASASVIIGVILFVGTLVINNVIPEETNDTVIKETVSWNRSTDNTSVINSSTYGKEINKNYDSLYITDMNLSLEDI